MLTETLRKKDAFERASKAGVVAITFAPSDALVPAPLKRMTSAARLDFNRFNGRRDLRVTDAGITETLSFGGSWHPVFLPWTSIYSITDERATTSFYHQPPVQLKKVAECTRPKLERIQGGGEVASVETELTAESLRRSFRCLKGGKS